MKILSFILLLFIAFSCSSGLSKSDVCGKYDVAFSQKAELDTANQAMMSMVAMFSAAQIQYEFQTDGIVNTSVTFGAMSNTTQQQWSLQGDSIFINSDRFKVEKKSDGLLLGSKEFNLVLKRK